MDIVENSFKPTMQKIDYFTLKRSSKIVIDSRENALVEAGDLIQAFEHKIINEPDIYAEIGEIAALKKSVREDYKEITFIKSVGNAVQEVALAKAIYQFVLKIIWV